MSHATLQKILLPIAPGELVPLDYLGPFLHNCCTLTTLDHFSKHIEQFTNRSANANTVAESIAQCITAHEKPSIIMTVLEYKFKRTNTFNIKLFHSNPTDSQTQGSSEHININVKTSIHSLMSKRFSFNLAALIHKFLFNNLIHSSKFFSLYFI